MSSHKKTAVKTMAYLGAAISEGQPKSGVQNSPDIYRKANLFSGLKHKFNLKNVNDYGNISLADVKR